MLTIENLTDSTPKQIRLNPQRQHTGHLPFWLATNHFCEEGLWFWTIPLQGKTSLGLVRLRVKKSSEELNSIFEALLRKVQDPTRETPFAEITDDDIDNLFND